VLKLHKPIITISVGINPYAGNGGVEYTPGWFLQNLT